jgi:1,2-phenylacetyl-CoA epoxidase PaaB subunit
MPRYGVIQNEETLQEVLANGYELFIPCLNQKDAHSKAVSLNNAKNRLTLPQQRKVRVQRAEVDGVWGVRIFPAAKTVIWKIVDGVKTLWDPEEGRLSDEDQRIFDLMMKDNVPLEQIIANLSEGKEAVIRRLYVLEKS